MNRIFYFLIHPRFLLIGLLERMGGWIPDKAYLRMRYLLNTKKWLKQNPPITFNEKLQWLKLNDRKPLYSTIVDKFTAKDYVASIIGKEFIIPTLGVWEKPEDIEFDLLPQRFVLKTTHDGGGEGVVICDKSHLDKESIKRRLHKSLKRNIYKSLREWPYKNIKPRIMAEAFIQPFGDNAEILKDYKFFCFNGEPKFCQVKSHEGGKDCTDLFDLQWNLLPFTGLNPMQGNALKTPERPANYEDMIDLAAKLCKVSNFVRVDFYNVDGRIYFGEITFYPASGMGAFTPSNYDEKLGELLKIGSNN